MNTLKLLALAVLLTCLSGCSAKDGKETDLPASLNQRATPAWFDDAKLGIFIHWGPYTVPAYAPKALSINQAFLHHYDDALLYSPYAEWYWNSLQFRESQSSHYHQEHYGPTVTYDDFGKQFRQDVLQWDPQAWAEQFSRTGAKYVILTTKHHDGFLLWPSSVRNPHKDHWQSDRDLVGELAAAVRARGMRFGVYYSGGLDWSWEPRGSKNIGDMLAASPTDPEYAHYVDAHFRELIERYQPSVLWNDIAYPQGALWQMVNDYYAAVPDGVINDRFIVVGDSAKYLRIPLVNKIVNFFIEKILKMHDGDISQMTSMPPPHFDFATREYSPTTTLQSQKWEATRGIGHSFALNKQETSDDLLTSRSLLRSFIDIVAKNGNLLLNVAVTSTGQIPADYIDRLDPLGEWLARNGDAVYDTRPWLAGEGVSADGRALRFTQNNGRYFVLVLEDYQPGQIELNAIPPILSARLLDGTALPVHNRDHTERIELPVVAQAEADVYVIEVTLK